MDESLQHESITHSMKLRKADINASMIVEAGLSSQSFEDLFLEHWSHIFRLILRLVGDPAEAEDLALETFFRLYQRYPPPEEDFNIAGWLHWVAINLGLRSIRNFKRRERYELAAGKGALDDAPENQPAEILAGEEERRFARMALTRMNPRQAQLLVMRYSGMTYKSIASALNLSPTSIGPLLLRAEREFEKRYHSLTQEEL